MMTSRRLKASPYLVARPCRVPLRRALQLRYTGLDPAAQYKVRVVYAGDSPRRKLRLVANDSFEVHGFIAKPSPYRPLEFDILPGATASGGLTLSWQGEPGLGGNGRNCQVSEVWLMKKAQ